ncbi:MAG: ABC transporter substrate-binding protein [Rhizomicrobium sp.]
MHSWMMKISLALAMAFTLFAPPALADAADPATPAVQSFYATLLDCMKGGKTLGAQGRYDKLKPVVEQTFDLGTMIKYAVGPTWSTASADDQKALTDAFTRMTIAQYAGNFASYDGEKFIVEPKADIRGADHYVKTSLVAKDQTVSFIYRMRQSGNDWKIIDILLEGSISQLSVYRSDFAATLKAGGPQALVKKINALADKALKD